jgi:hypothetical protein
MTITARVAVLVFLCATVLRSAALAQHVTPTRLQGQLGPIGDGLYGSAELFRGKPGAPLEYRLYTSAPSSGLYVRITSTTTEQRIAEGKADDSGRLSLSGVFPMDGRVAVSHVGTRPDTYAAWMTDHDPRPTPTYSTAFSDPTADPRAVHSGWNLPANYPAPDIALVMAVVSEGVLRLSIRYAPGSFDPARTVASVNIDTDMDASTGWQEAGFLPGADYGFGFGGPAGYKHHLVRLGAGGGIVGDAPAAEVLDEGLYVEIPLARIGDDDGRLALRVSTKIGLGGGSTGYVMDDAPRDGWIVVGPI